MYTYIRNYVLLCSLLLLWISCSEESGQYPVPEYATGVKFQLHPDRYPGEQTRSDDTSVKFDKIAHYVMKEDGRLTTNIRIIYNSNLSQINVEGLQDGSYYLLVLGIYGSSDEDGAIINSLTDSSSPWLTFRDAHLHKPLSAEYFYARYPFTVSSGQVSNPVVNLKRIVSQIGFQLTYCNDYVRKSVTSIDVIPDINFHTTLNGDGTLSGSQDIHPFSLLDKPCFMLLSAGQGTPFSGKLALQTQRPLSTDKSFMQEYRFDTTIYPNQRSRINVKVIHPDDAIGTMYVTEADYTAENFYTILADDESQDVYYDTSQRAFNVNQPLQASIREDSLHLRFYSPVPISNVMIYATVMNENIELAYIKHLPAFTDAVFKLPFTSDTRIFRTESGKIIQIPVQNLETLPELKFKVVSDDPYWQKISQIEAKWRITFSSFGGNPDLPNGGPNGNWMGMRPVHAREVISVLTNVAYMCTLEDFRERALSYQGRIMGNDGVTPVDMSTVINRLQSHASFNTGLVYTANGVTGLAGGATWGVSQSTYFNHYTHYGPTQTIFHELAHCMGYSHSSGMTYGPWSRECANKFYVDNITRLPVNSKDILNSVSNPNRY